MGSDMSLDIRDLVEVLIACVTHEAITERMRSGRGDTRATVFGQIDQISIHVLATVDAFL